MSEPTLRLLVHDYDEGGLRERYEALVAALPETVIEPHSSRASLLTDIAGLPESPQHGVWPLALVDLQDEHGVQARGEHLLATIDAHPQLRRRVVLVAFTRYGYETHDSALRQRGARAVLSPIDLDEIPDLRRELEVVASGTAPFARIGEPPSSDADRRVVERLALLFPALDDPGLDERSRWERARRVLTLCHLKHDGWDDAAIKRLPWVKDRDLDELRAELRLSPAARPLISAAGRTPHLDRVIDVMLPHLQGSELMYDVLSDRTRLDAVPRLGWIRERLADRYPAEGPAPKDDDAWIPPTYLEALRRFFELVDGLPAPAGHAKTETLTERSQRAIAVVASELEVEPEVAGRYVTHAVMCLEDAEAERFGEAPPIER